MQKLTNEEWTLLDNLMQDVPDPETTYTATGWHFRLQHLLGTYGIRVAGRYDAFDTAMKLWEGEHGF